MAERLRMGVLFSFVDATQTYTKLHEFNNSLSTDGGAPFNSLIVASDGKLYGTTTQDGASGGSFTVGTIFSYTINTSTFAKVYNFIGATTGRNPQTALLQASNGKFYGLCKDNGNGPFGTAYSFDPSTSTFVKLTDLFVLSNGGKPKGAIIKASNGLFYGLTKSGGANFSGVLFSFNPSTYTYTKLIDLPANANPEGALVQASNGKLYGMTVGGGSSGLGSIFSYDIGTNTYTVVANLVNATGRSPSGSLIQGSDGNLYGMTTYGGANSVGAIFKFVISTSTYTNVADFNSAVNGASPYGSLMQASNGLMYGMTTSGGSLTYGTLFEFNPTSSALTKLFDFGGLEGVTPWGNVMQASNGKLYGLTLTSLFSYDPTLNSLVKLHTFGQTGTTGKFLYGNLFPVCKRKTLRRNKRRWFVWMWYYFQL
ncbi:MAG: hypothetical protein IPI10_15360 [Bacteroidetes bacterium]|nr:hypothetical protein [Bacteroidota bacterium]